MSEWQPIETAPKDGTRVMLWRGPANFGNRAEMVITEWHDGAWCWPDGVGSVSTHGEWTEDDILNGYEDAVNFTHWMPLPPAPN